MKKIFLSILFLALLFNKTKSQVLLSPAELISISKTPDSVSIDKMLMVKGYKVGYGWETGDQEKVNNWLFQSKPGEFVDFTLRRVTQPSCKTETLYWISNNYFYKEFMANLKRNNFIFSEISVIDKLCYFVFKKGNDSILVTCRQALNSDNFYFEIKIG